MIYSRKDREVTVTFDIEEFGNLLGILGAALIMSKNEGFDNLTAVVGKFIDDLNRTNNDFTLYLGEIVTLHGDKTPS